MHGFLILLTWEDPMFVGSSHSEVQTKHVWFIFHQEQIWCLFSCFPCSSLHLTPCDFLMCLFFVFNFQHFLKQQPDLVAAEHLVCCCWHVCTKRFFKDPDLFHLFSHADFYVAFQIIDFNCNLLPIESITTVQLCHYAKK